MLYICNDFNDKYRFICYIVRVTVKVGKGKYIVSFHEVDNRIKASSFYWISMHFKSLSYSDAIYHSIFYQILSIVLCI